MMQEDKETVISNINKEPIGSSENIKFRTMIITIQENISSYSVACPQRNKNFRNATANVKIDKKYKELLKVINETL